MLAGYCHYYGDAIIYVARSRILTPGPLRLTGTDAAKAFGDIDDLRPSDDRYNEVWKRVTEWFDAVRRPNSPQFKDYATDHCAPVASGDRLTRECGAEIEERFAFLRNGLPPAIKFYSRRTKPLYGPQSDYLALGCVCRTANCEGQWPIHSVDTSSSAWPYVCVHVSREGSEFKVY
jgi:hypothetical protein